MPIVIDASAIVTLAFPDEDQHYVEDLVQELATETGIVPTLFWDEVINVLAVNVTKRARLSIERALDYLDVFQGLGLNLDLQINDTERLGLAIQYKLSGYDATYLQLALLHEATLATQDRELKAAARDAGVTVFGD